MIGVHVGRGAARYGFTRGVLPGGGHLLTADRFDAYWAELTRRQLHTRVVPLDAPPATDDELHLFHTPAYVAELRARCAANTGALDASGSTPAEPQIAEAGAAVAGAVLDAARRVIAGGVRRAFVPIAGFHHAWPDHARVYCALNDVGVLLRWLIGRGFSRIAYVDIDVHLGDGVLGPLADEPALHLVDLHQRSGTFWYSRFASDEAPELPAHPRQFNLALEPKTGNSYYLEQWARAREQLAAVRPDFVVLDAGVDSLAGDRLGGLALTSAVHRQVVHDLAALADLSASGRMVVVGGGGYGTDRAAQGWAEVTEALLETVR
jgi:acetoin utilization protein AcuC